MAYLPYALRRSRVALARTLSVTCSSQSRLSHTHTHSYCTCCERHMPFAVFLTMIACDAKLRIEFFFQTNSIVWKRRIIRTHTLTHTHAHAHLIPPAVTSFSLCVCVSVCRQPTECAKKIVRLHSACVFHIEFGCVLLLTSPCAFLLF